MRFHTVALLSSFIPPLRQHDEADVVDKFVELPVHKCGDHEHSEMHHTSRCHDPLIVLILHRSCADSEYMSSALTLSTRV